MPAPDSFEFAKDTVTQLITLATAVIGVSVTFSKDVQQTITPGHRRLLFSAWMVLLVSVFLGVWTLMALTGTLTKLPVAADGIYGSNITIPCILQVLTFLGGIVLLMWHASSK
jgi:hypothetical protein